MSRTLLLADDSVTTQRVLALTFSGEDVRVVAVNDGEQAIARISAEPPDIVLADIAMPKRSGYDVSAFVKGHPQLQHIPVLLLAGAFEPVDRARAEEARCDGILVKPFEPRQVVARVWELLHGVRGYPLDAATAAVERPVEALGIRAVGPPRDEASTEPLESAATDEGDAFFLRLDAAIASRQERTPTGGGSDDDDLEVPTLDKLLSRPLAENISGGSGEGAAALTAGPPVLMSDAFSALLALEEGEPGAKPVRLTVRSQPLEVSADFIDEVVARVVERLAPDLVRDVVVEVVSDVAERLVRDEIARIRAG